MKTCKCCSQVKPYNDFTKSKVVKDGYENKCKSCRADERKKYVNKCVECDNEFKTAKAHTKYCSPSCKPQNQRDRVNVNCATCGKEKSITQSHKDNYKNHYCSNVCKDLDHGKLYSGASHPRYNQIDGCCGNCKTTFKTTPYLKAKSIFQYCSVDCKDIHYKERFRGKSNPNWNELLTDEERIERRKYPEYHAWRESVFKRDSYECKRCCDNTGHNLQAHHIQNHAQHKGIRLELSNGITLCKTCHKEFHDTYGYSNNNQAQLDEYLFTMTIPSQAKQKCLEGVETR